MDSYPHSNRISVQPLNEGNAVLLATRNQNPRASRDTYTIPFSTDLGIIYLAKPNIVMEWRMSKIPIRQ